MPLNKKKLEAIYRTYNHRHFVHPDPLEFLYLYTSPRDQEIVGLMASSLAYGHVKQILKSVSQVIKIMGISPFTFLQKNSVNTMDSMLHGFKHRWHTGSDVAILLCGIKKIIDEFGSLEACFKKGLKEQDKTIIPALSHFVDKLKKGGGEKITAMLPSPGKGSATKRLHMYLRWMIRKDDVDPGCWSGISPSKLIMPVDTHIHRICLQLRMTRKKQANMKTALEITEKFRHISPEDPVKYDFVLTRFGIRNDLDDEPMIKSLAAKT